jgi:hypothetical protein
MIKKIIRILHLFEDASEDESIKEMSAVHYVLYGEFLL